MMRIIILTTYAMDSRCGPSFVKNSLRPTPYAIRIIIFRLQLTLQHNDRKLVMTEEYQDASSAKQLLDAHISLLAP